MCARSARVLSVSSSLQIIRAPCSIRQGNERMQQASTAKPGNDVEASGTLKPPQGLRNRFVINLCSSTTPVSLTPPDHAGLKRFTFYVSRRREEGRERFRLHMGYFDSQEDAERLLDIVREIYPGAWAGLAPGQRLRAQQELEQAEAAAMAAAATAAAPAESAASAAPPVAESAPAPVAASSPEQSPTASSSPVPTPLDTQALSLIPDEGRRVTDLLDAASENQAAARALSNVRAAIASLDDTTTRAPTLLPLPELQPVTKPASTTAEASEPPREISGAAALNVLEGGGDSSSATTVRQPQLPSGDDTAATRLMNIPAMSAAAAAKSAAGARPHDEKTAYAVQLLWSVQPIDIAQIPQLAIFSAYTLYGAEGNRDGRRWYGVRLGFFTDAVSAKQVAHYVRSDFSTVSVVPVTARERERAKIAVARPEAMPVSAVPAAPSAPVAAAAAATTAREFQFIEDKPQTPVARPAGAVDGAAARSTRGAPGKRAKLRTGRQVNGRAKSKAMTLEETLEILGAGSLQIEDSRRPLINEDAPRGGATEQAKGKPSRFGRLLERLSERLGS
jgi:hypothetical protein